MIIEIRPLDGQVADMSFFINGHYLAKDKNSNTFVCDAMDLLRHQLKSISGTVLNLTWHKAIKEIKKGAVYSEYTFKQESVVLLKDIHRHYGTFELRFFEEGKEPFIHQLQELSIKDIDTHYPIKLGSVVRMV